MAIKRLNQLSGKIRARDLDKLDSDRYTFLDISQAEPNAGLPIADGAVFSSTVSGTRSFTSQPLLNGIIFRGNELDSAKGGSERMILALRNPGINDSVGLISLRELIGDSGGADTLHAVVTKGDSTSLAITIGGLRLTGAESDGGTTSLLVLNELTDSVGLRSFASLADAAGLISQGDQITAGGLTITGVDSNPNTTTVLVLDDSTDSVGKRSFQSLASDAGLIAQGDAITAGGLQLTVADSDPTTTSILVLNQITDSVGIRSFASLSDLGADTLQQVTDRGDSTSLAITIGGLSLSALDSDPTTTELLVRNLLTDSVGKRSFGSLAEDAGLIAQGDAASIGGLQLTVVDSDATTNTILVLNETTDSVGKRTFNSLATEAGLIAQGDDINAGGLTISARDSDSDTNQILVLNLNTDSVGIRSFQSLASEAGLISQGNNITAGGLTISNLDSDSDTNQLLVVDLTTDSIGKRSFKDLAEQAGLVAQGDDISAGGLTIAQADSNANTNQILVLDLNTDSVGKRSFNSLADAAGLISQGDAVTANGLSITARDSDSATDQVLVLNLNTDSVGIRSFANLADDAGLISQGDNIRAGGLTISQIDSDSSRTILVLDLATDSVGKRDFASLATEAGLGADTLQIVTDRGDSTTNSITIAGLSMTQAESDGTTTSLLVLNELTDSVGIRSFANLVDDAGLGQDTLQSVTDRGDSTTNQVFLKGGITANNLPVNNTTTTVLVLTSADSVAQRTFASLSATEVDNLQDVTDRGDSTDNDILIRASLNADSVKANTGFFDTNNNQLIIFDSAGAILWGA
jgi:hypothetical protein